MFCCTIIPPLRSIYPTCQRSIYIFHSSRDRINNIIQNIIFDFRTLPSFTVINANLPCCYTPGKFPRLINRNVFLFKFNLTHIIFREFCIIYRIRGMNFIANLASHLTIVIISRISNCNGTMNFFCKMHRHSWVIVIVIVIVFKRNSVIFIYLQWFSASFFINRDALFFVYSFPVIKILQFIHCGQILQCFSSRRRYSNRPCGRPILTIRLSAFFYDVRFLWCIINFRRSGCIFLIYWGRIFKYFFTRAVGEIFGYLCLICNPIGSRCSLLIIWKSICKAITFWHRSCRNTISTYPVLVTTWIIIHLIIPDVFLILF